MHEKVAIIIDQIVALRQARGLSQRQLAAISGIAQSAIARLEQKHIPPTVETVCRILDALDAELTIVDTTKE